MATLGLTTLYLVAVALLALTLPALHTTSRAQDAEGPVGPQPLLCAGSLLAYSIPALAYLLPLSNSWVTSGEWLPTLILFLPGGVAVLSLSLRLTKTPQPHSGADSERERPNFTDGEISVEARAHHERQDAISELTASVAHGVRNPLASVRAAAQIAREIGSEPEVSDLLSSILQECDRLDLRIRHLVNFSKPLTVNIRRVDLRDIVRVTLDAATRRAKDQNVVLEQECPAEFSKLESDPELLENALFELVMNGLAAMPEGGRLGLSVGGGQGFRSLRVWDTGSGVSEGVRDRLFEPFVTTRQDTAGIGLATVQKTVRTLQGKVQLESTGSDGSVFFIELPDHDGTSPPPTPKTPRLPTSGRRNRSTG